MVASLFSQARSSSRKLRARGRANQREGPLSDARLQELLGRSPSATAELVQRLLDDGRVQRQGGQLVARDFVVPLGASAGWEAAVFDHLQAVVQTVCQRLRQTSFDAEAGPLVGGSTYSFDVWPGHPLEKVVNAQLAEIRKQLGALRQEVERHNQAEGVPQDYRQVVTYVGQCFTQRNAGVETEEEEVEHDGSL